jgi:UPF0755 protein
MLGGLIALAVTGAIFVVGGRFAYLAFAPASAGSKDQLVFEVQRGQGPNDVARALAEKGVVSDAANLIWLGRMTRQWGNLKAGEYQVSPAMTPLEILSVLTSGKSMSYPVTIREGANIYEVADLVAARGLMTKKQFLQLCRDPKFIATTGIEPAPASLEGYLFPETYFVNKTTVVEELVRQMVRKTISLWGEAERARAQALGLSQHQVMTLASMIEKETGAPQERPIISSVFHNRLRKRMRLQSDPTTIYGMWERYTGNIRKSDLLTHSPYNTYTIPALPVGPIGNPGKEALQAALFPEQSEFLYFVSHNDGTHEFTRTFDEHSKAVRKFQLDPKARAGKSWRDLNRKTSSPEQTGE